jgi:hypothetical protein
VAIAHDAAETVLWQERRAPPYPQLVLVPAFMAAISAAAAPGAAARIALAVVALAFAALAWKVRGTGWIEHFVLTDKHIVVARPDGSRISVPLADLRAASVDGARVSLAGVAGERVLLGHVNRRARLLRALGRAAPDVAIEHRVDTLCPT